MKTLGVRGPNRKILTRIFLLSPYPEKPVKEKSLYF